MYLKLKYIVILLVGVFLLDCSATQKTNTAEKAASRGDIYASSSADDIDLSDQPEWLAERLEWFEDLKFGILFSWGQCVVWGGHQSWCISPDAPWARPDEWEPWIENDKDLTKFTEDYFELYKKFNPVDFNPDEWAELAEYAGVKYIGITTKHHDGFCLFDTKTTDFKITSTESPFHQNRRANLTREIFDAFRRRGLAISCYFSKSDWHTPHYWNSQFPVTDRNVNYNTSEHPEIWDKFKDYTFRQIEELMKDYGKIDILWLDGGQVRPPAQDIDMPKIANMARSHQDRLIIVDRTVGGKYENIITPEQHIPGEPIEQTWETCATIQKHGWTWRPDVEYRTTKELLFMLVDIVSKGGNFFLGVGPDPKGKLDPKTESRLREIGDWMQINGESIHKTRPWVNFAEGEDIRFTRTKDWKQLYVHALEWPGKELKLRTIRPRPGTKIKLLGYEQPLNWHLVNEQLVIKIPEILQIQDKRPCSYSWVFKLDVVQPVLAVSMNPSGAIFKEDDFQISLNTETDDAQIFYTTDGHNPDMNSKLFTNPFIVEKSSIVRAVSYTKDSGYSPVTAGYFFKKPEPYTSIKLASKASTKYPGSGASGLNDGIKADTDFTDSDWLGFEGNDLELIIDLGENRPLQMIASSFLQDQQKWIFLPEYVEYSISQDGDHFKKIKTIPEKNRENNKINSRYFVHQPQNTFARYIRIFAKNVSICPPWHKGAGGNAWLFIDEVIIE